MQKSTNPAKRHKYDASFKEQVLQMVSNGRPIREVSEALGIGENLIYKWKRRSATPAQPPEPASAAELATENQQLKALLRKAEAEREILKKALLIFGQQT